MKREISFKSLFGLLVLLCVGIGLAALSGGDPLAALAVAPLAATFDPANLKIPASEFETLRAKYKQLYVLDIEIDEAEKYQFIARRPTRETISAVEANKDNLDKANEIIVKNMIVAGDKEALDDGIVFSRVLTELGRIMQQGKSSFMKA